MKSIKILIFIIVFGVFSFSAEINDFFAPNISSYLFVNFSALNEKGLIKKVQKDQSEEEKEKIRIFSEKTGFEPEKHLRNILVIMGDKVFSDKKDVSVIFNGLFDKKKILDYFLSEKVRKYKEETYNKISFYTAQDGYSFAFIGNDSIAFGGLDILKKISDNIGKKTKNNFLSEKYIKNSQYDLQGTLTFNDEQKELINKMYPKFPSFDGLKSLDISASFDKTLNINAFFNTDTKESSQQISAVLKNLRILGIIYGAKLGFSEMISGIEILEEENKAGLSMVIDDNEMIKVKESLNKIKKRQKNGSDSK